MVDPNTLRSVSQRQEIAERKKKPSLWSTLTPEMRASILSIMLLTTGAVLLTAGVSTILTLLVSPEVGLASVGVCFGIIFLVVGVLLGLDKD